MVFTSSFFQGYTIPLDKRLAADGRGLQDPHINDKFAKLAEALYIADRKVLHLGWFFGKLYGPVTPVQTAFLGAIFLNTKILLLGSWSGRNARPVGKESCSERQGETRGQATKTSTKGSRSEGWNTECFGYFAYGLLCTSQHVNFPFWSWATGIARWQCIMGLFPRCIATSLLPGLQRNFGMVTCCTRRVIIQAFSISHCAVWCHRSPTY